mgnify:CR=1 FL=1
MNVDVVIVTYNRLEKLKNTLQCYENQTKTFRNLIVVNNHSTDGTSEYLEEWNKKDTSFEKHIITTKENLGGAGGFFVGESHSMKLNPDWIFIADDDAYPEPNLMEKFYAFEKEHHNDDFSAICAAVYQINGSIDVSHRSRYTLTNKRYFSWNSVPLEEYKAPYFDIDFLTYVGPFINAKAIEKVGYVNPSFFIYNDDSEHSLRLKKYGRIICVPEMKITHDVKIVGQFKEQVKDDNILVSWGDYYSTRNEMVMFKQHFPELAKYRFKTALKKCLKRKYKTPYEKVVWNAMRDGWFGNLGKNRKYLPGWSVKK